MSGSRVLWKSVKLLQNITEIKEMQLTKSRLAHKKCVVPSVNKYFLHKVLMENNMCFYGKVSSLVKKQVKL